MNNEKEQLKKAVEIVMKAIRECKEQDIGMLYAVLVIANEKLERDLK